MITAAPEPIHYYHSLPLPKAEALAQLLLCLADVCGLPLDPTHARRAAREAPAEGEALAAAAFAAEECGLVIRLARLPLEAACWQARPAQPLCLWAAHAQEWLIVQRRGLLGVVVTRPANPEEEETYHSFDALAKHLGLSSGKEATIVGLVQARQQAEGLAGETSSTTWHGPHLHAPGATAHPSPFARLRGFMQPEMHDVWSIIIFSGITGLLYLALPLAVNAFVSNLSFGAKSGPFLQALLFLTLALLVCLALSAGLRGLQQYVTEVIQRRIFVRLAMDLAHRLPRVKASAWDTVHGPEMVNRFLDVVTVQKSTAMLLLTGINAFLGAIIGLVVLAFYHPFLLGFAFFILLALLGITFGLGRRAVSTSITESYAKYEVVNWLEELARHPRIFKGPGGRALAVERAEVLSRSYLQARRGHFRILLRQICGLLGLEIIASVALLALGGLLVLNHQLTLGQLVASELIMTVIVASIAKLGKQFEAWYDALAAVDKLGHLVDLPCEEEGGEPVSSPQPGMEVEMKSLCFTRRPGHPAFRVEAEHLKPGERVAVTGRSGSGRSTFLELLAGLHHPASGFLALDGVEVHTWARRAHHEQVLLLRPGDVLQGTVVENVRLGRDDISLQNVQSALVAVKMLEVVTSWPQGLHTPLITGGGTLTRTHRTRLLLARALALKPRLLLLDDLFEDLEADELDDCLAPILHPQRAWTVVIATHQPQILARLQRTLHLPPPQ